jgi:capsular polysaccharide biosynthesis protein
MGDRLMVGVPRSARAWAVVIVAATVTGALIGALVSRTIEPTYAATTTMLVGNLERGGAGPDVRSSAAVAAIYGELIRGDSVLTPVIGRLGLATDWQELRKRVHVDIGANDVPIITVTVYARSSSEATATAGAITDQMVTMSRPGTTAIAAEDIPTAVATSNDLRVLQTATPKGGLIRPHVVTDTLLGAAIGCLVGFIFLLGVTLLRATPRGGSPGGSVVDDPWARELVRS